jgi:hypothetical protein
MIRIVLVLLESSEKIIILTKLVKMTSFKNKIHLGVDGLMVKASAFEYELSDLVARVADTGLELTVAAFIKGPHKSLNRCMQTIPQQTSTIR